MLQASFSDMQNLTSNAFSLCSMETRCLFIFAQDVQPYVEAKGNGISNAHGDGNAS